MKDFPQPISDFDGIGIIQLLNTIQQWGVDRNIIGPNEQGNMMAQSMKLIEECMEVREGVFLQEGLELMADVLPNVSGCEDDRDAKLKEAYNKITDGIGDTMVVCVMLCALHGISVRKALEKAWSDIKNRKGEMINGTFVKEVPENDEDEGITMPCQQGGSNPMEIRG